MKEWSSVKLSELLQFANEGVPVHRDQSHPNFCIYSFAKGLLAKPDIDGIKTSASALYRIRAGNFIYSRLFAFDGSCGLIDKVFDVPNLAKQQSTIPHINALAEKTRQLEAHLDAVERDAEHLLALRFCEAIANAPLQMMARR